MTGSDKEVDLPGHPSNPTGRTGRPPLTERRKAATRLEIARTAVRLFTSKGVAATSADEIAAAAGISVRTYWRYFPTKESCVWPLLTPGIEATARCLRAWRPGQGVEDLVDDLARDSDTLAADVPATLALIRLTRTEPGLRAVWLQAHGDAEPAFAAALGERGGRPGDDLPTKVQAATINGALRAAVEHYAWHADPAEPPETHVASILDAIRSALLTATQGLRVGP